jgi:hypothetical protein
MKGQQIGEHRVYRHQLSHNKPGTPRHPPAPKSPAPTNSRRPRRTPLPSILYTLSMCRIGLYV